MSAHVDVGHGQEATFHGRRAVLTSKHGKHRQIAPALRRAGIDVDVLALDTDALGTFSGEVERPAPALETAVRKARLGMDATGADLGVASEGSFTPHPSVPWVSVDRELVVLVDDRTGLVVVGGALSTSTLAWSATCTPDDDLPAVLAPADLPHHAVLVRPHLGRPEPVVKGLTSLDEVADAVARCAQHSPDGLAGVETDLRAHLSPSRQRVIVAAAEDLAERLLRCCPRCQSPGWGHRETLLGVPCAWCSTTIAAPRAELDACPACAFTQERLLIAPGETADPAQCGRCNP